MDSEDEQYYANDSDIDGDEDGDDYDDTDDVTSTHPHQKTYSILTEADVRQRQDKDITTISNVLSIATDAASVLLRYYNWDVVKVQEEWFADEEKVRDAVGLLEKPVAQIQKKTTHTCRICFESYPPARVDAADCGHSFCIECYTSYISTSISDGAGCLMLQCPDPSCKVSIGQDMINRLACDQDKEKYSRYLVRSYVEASRKTKWCPAPNCDNAVDFVMGSESYDVHCTCSYSFCWNCTEDAHRPVDCETVGKWIVKNSDESENTNWILANSKPCPKCKKPIEKNLGCMHMTCRPPCRYEFCWLCLNDWSGHGGACNGYDKVDAVLDPEEKRREMAKMYIEKYTHYFERWAANHNSRMKALADLKKMQTEDDIDKLREKHGKLEADLNFITEAWQQIVECRRVLKWTYAYGYYLPEDEIAKKQLFEYLQGQAESGLERLHKCAEEELKVYLDAEGPSGNFIEFREKLAGLTLVTRNYFDNLVRALENGLCEVNWFCEYCTFSNVEFASSCQMCSLPKSGGFHHFL